MIDPQPRVDKVLRQKAREWACEWQSQPADFVGVAWDRASGE